MSFQNSVEPGSQELVVAVPENVRPLETATTLHLLENQRPSSATLCGFDTNRGRVERRIKSPDDAAICSRCAAIRARRRTATDGGLKAPRGVGAGAAVARPAVRFDVPDAGVQIELSRIQAVGAALAVVGMSATLGAWLS